MIQQTRPLPVEQVSPPKRKREKRETFVRHPLLAEYRLLDMGPVNPAAFSKKTIMGRDVTLYTTPYIQALSTGWAGCYWLLRFHICLGSPQKIF
jgi:hypothetical protein